LMPSFVTRVLFKLVGHRIGRHCRIRILSYVYAEDMVIGNDVEIRPFVFIKVNALSLGNSTIISFGTQIKGNRKFSTRGSNFIGVHCLINCEEDVSVGFYSGIGPRSIIYTHGSFLPITLGYPAKFAPVVIGDYVWISMAVTILAGTHVENNCIINPGVLLKSKVRANSLIDCKPELFSRMNLLPLQTFLKHLPAVRLEHIIEDFFVYEHMEYVHHKNENSFSFGKNHVFKYFPDSETIELSIENKKIIYDMARFLTTFSTARTHKRFLFFLRRRCGIILQNCD